MPQQIKRLAGWAIALALLITSCSHRARTHVVVIDATNYGPAADTIQLGDTVVWQNKDLFAHTVTARDSSFDSKNIEASASWRFVPHASGTFAYTCIYHPTMQGTLVVR